MKYLFSTGALRGQEARGKSKILMNNFLSLICIVFSLFMT